jgi:hypothetical protein
MVEEADELFVEDPQNTRKKGYNFDSFMHQTYYDAFRGYAEAWKEDPPLFRYAYAQGIRASIPLIMANRRLDLLEELKPKINLLNSMLLTAANNQISISNFFIATQDLVHWIALKSRKTGFVPAKREVIAPTEIETVE